MTTRPIAETLETIERVRGNLECADAALATAKAAIRDLSLKVVEPIRREDFDSDGDFRRAAQDQSLRIMTGSMSQEALDAINSDELLEALQSLDDDQRKRLDEVTQQQSEALKAVMKDVLGSRYDEFFPQD